MRSGFDLDRANERIGLEKGHLDAVEFDVPAGVVRVVQNEDPWRGRGDDDLDPPETPPRLFASRRNRRQGEVAMLRVLLGAFLAAVTIFVFSLQQWSSQVGDVTEIATLTAGMTTKLEGIQSETRVGQRTVQDIILARKELSCARELHAVARARAMTTGWSAESIKNLAFLPFRIKHARLGVAEQFVADLGRELNSTQQRFAVGELTDTDLVTARVALIEAEIFGSTESRARVASKGVG